MLVRFGNGKDLADPKEVNFNGSKTSKRAYAVVGEYRAQTSLVYFLEKAKDEADQIWEARGMDAHKLLKKHRRTPYRKLQS